MSGIYPLRYRPCPRNSRISIRLFLLFSFFLLFFQLSLSPSPPPSLAVSRFFSISLFHPFAVTPEGFESSISDRSPSFPVLCFNVSDISDSRASIGRSSPRSEARVLSSFLQPFLLLLLSLRLRQITLHIFFLSLSRGVSRRRERALFLRAVRIFSLSMNNKRPIIFRSPRHLLSIRSPNIRLALNLGEMLNETFFMLKNIFNYACRTG